MDVVDRCASAETKPDTCRHFCLIRFGNGGQAKDTFDVWVGGIDIRLTAHQFYSYANRQVAAVMSDEEEWDGEEESGEQQAAAGVGGAVGTEGCVSRSSFYRGTWRHNKTMEK